MLFIRENGRIYKKIYLAPKLPQLHMLFIRKMGAYRKISRLDPVYGFAE